MFQDHPLQQWRDQAKQEAEQQGISTQEVDQLLEHYGWSRLHQVLNQPPPTFDLERLNQCWRIRVDQKFPLQYILGSVIWFNLPLWVTPAVLIPRPETEQLVEAAISWIQTYSGDQPGYWVDLGTGSGAIAIALAQSIANLMMIAIDKSPEALTVAQRNIQQFHLEHRIQCRQGSWFEPLKVGDQKLQGLISNPPYIPSAQIPTLQPEVAWHEPRTALDGGPTGLESIQHLIQEAPHYLQAGAGWIIEVMQGQAEQVAQQLDRQGSYCDIQILQDLAGIDRIVSARLSKGCNT